MHAASSAAGQDGLADSRHILDQHVTLAQQPDQQQLDLTRLPTIAWSRLRASS
jgi:hypothetical protein